MAGQALANAGLDLVVERAHGVDREPLQPAVRHEERNLAHRQTRLGDVQRGVGAEECLARAKGCLPPLNLCRRHGRSSRRVGEHHALAHQVRVPLVALFAGALGVFLEVGRLFARHGARHGKRASMQHELGRELRRGVRLQHRGEREGVLLLAERHCVRARLARDPLRLLDRAVGVLRVPETDEARAARPARRSVHRDARVADRAEGAEQLPQLPLCCFEGKVAHEDGRAHIRARQRGLDGLVLLVGRLLVFVRVVRARRRIRLGSLGGLGVGHADVALFLLLLFVRLRVRPAVRAAVASRRTSAVRVTVGDVSGVLGLLLLLRLLLALRLVPFILAQRPVNGNGSAIAERLGRLLGQPARLALGHSRVVRALDRLPVDGGHGALGVLLDHEPDKGETTRTRRGVGEL